jgi:hypothetical protein
MQSQIHGSAVIPIGEGAVATYSMLRDEAAAAGALGCELYGVQVEMGEETASRPRLTASKTSVSALLDKLAAGGVTPTALNDVVDDWLTR